MIVVACGGYITYSGNFSPHKTFAFSGISVRGTNIPRKWPDKTYDPREFGPGTEVFV